MNYAFHEHLRHELAQLKQQGLYKTERVITSPHGAVITTGGCQVLNLCANNYLGLAGDPGRISFAQFPRQKPHRPSVGDDMVDHEHH